MKSLRIVFFGTPDYAVPTLESLAKNDRYDIVLAVTQPDRPAGRKRELRSSAVKTAANKLGIPVYQPETLRSPQARAPLEKVNADVFVVAAYGLIFGEKTLAIPRIGCVNLHASVLPSYRGASPISAAILTGDSATGVTLMRMEAGLDTGPVIAIERESIASDDTTGTLTTRLAIAGARLAGNAIWAWASGELSEVPQSTVGASLTRPLVRADGWLDWSAPAIMLDRKIRAMTPWPLAWTMRSNGDQMQILSGSAVDGNGAAPGTVDASSTSVTVACGDGAILLGRVRLAGGTETEATALVRGRKLDAGEVLGTSPLFQPPPPLIRAAYEADY